MDYTVMIGVGVAFVLLCLAIFLIESEVRD